LPQLTYVLGTEAEYTYRVNDKQRFLISSCEPRSV